MSIFGYRVTLITFGHKSGDPANVSIVGHGWLQGGDRRCQLELNRFDPLAATPPSVRKVSDLPRCFTPFLMGLRPELKEFAHTMPSVLVLNAIFTPSVLSVSSLGVISYSVWPPLRHHA